MNMSGLAAAHSGAQLIHPGLLTRWGYVRAGSYQDIPQNVDFVVNLTTELDTECNLRIPTRDFSVPDEHVARAGLQAIIRRLIEGDEVFIHCFGGTGRTGLFLSLLAKVSGEKDPIGYVRKVYRKGAVETEEQEDFIEQFSVNGLLTWANLYQQSRQDKLTKVLPPPEVPAPVSVWRRWWDKMLSRWDRVMSWFENLWWR